MRTHDQAGANGSAAAAVTSEAPAGARRGLEFERAFAKEGVHPFDEITWETRTAEITDETGKAVFRQEGVEAPAFFSQLATNVVASKYFRGDESLGPGDPAAGHREHSVKQLVGRVANTIAMWGLKDGYFDTVDSNAAFVADLHWLLANQYAAFNSPVWFNVGLSQCYGLTGGAAGWVWDSAEGAAVPCEDALERPQCSACFIVAVEDSMDSILERAKTEGMLFKYGSGVGSDNSTIRSAKEKLAGGGKPSGPLSFMRIYDAVGGVIKSGGKTRRAAKIETLKDVHPDIMEFVRCKPAEERKARALVGAGYSGGMDGDAYTTVCFQNSNLSVRASDAFLSAAEAGGPWLTRAVTTGAPVETLDASKILDEMAEGAWFCGDPGIQYEDTINRWHTCPNAAPINSSNPCSEYMFIDDSACNLASINLMKFRRPDGSFDVGRFRAAVRILIVAQDILVDRASYPTKKIAENSHRFRPLGLGYANLGALVMASGLPYDSEEGRALAGSVTALMNAEAWLTSAELAERLGPFGGYEADKANVLRVFGMHWEAADAGWIAADPKYGGHREGAGLHPVWAEADKVYMAASMAAWQVGVRNAQLTLIAPTGTIGFAMDCDTFGVEPDIALVKYKKLAGGGNLKIVNQTVPEALRKLGYEKSPYDRPGGGGKRLLDSGLEWIAEHDTIEGWPGLMPEHLPVFDCAFTPRKGVRSIAWEGHVKMMAAVQPHLSGAISKTVNMPKDATPADIRGAYLLGWKLGLKALAVYRDGSKESQPLNTSAGATTAEPAAAPVPSYDDGTPMEPDMVAEQNGMLREVNARQGERIKELVELERVVGEYARVDAATGAVESPPLTARRLGAALEAVARSHGQPRRERLPDTRPGLTHKGSVDGHEFYLTVGFFADGRPGELFIQMAKEGSTVGGLMDTIGTLASMGLQYGVPLDVLVRKFRGQKFEPSGMTHSRDIPFAQSLVDYVFGWLGMEFIPGYREVHAPRRESEPGAVAVVAGERIEVGDAVYLKADGKGYLSETASESRRFGSGVLAPAPVRGGSPAPAPPPRMSLDGPVCAACGGMTVPAGRCWVCSSCATSVGGCA